MRKDLKIYKLENGFLIVKNNTVIDILGDPKDIAKRYPQFTKSYIVINENRNFYPFQIREESPFKEFNPPKTIERNGETWYHYDTIYDTLTHKRIALYGPGHIHTQVITTDDETQSQLRGFYFRKEDFKNGERFHIETRQSTLPDNPFSRNVAVKFGEINVLRTDNHNDAAVRFNDVGELTVEALGYGLTVIADAVTHEILVEEIHAVGSHNLDIEKLEKLAVAFETAGFKTEIDYEFGGELEIKDPESNETLILFDCHGRIFYKPSMRAQIQETFKNYKGVKI